VDSRLAAAVDAARNVLAGACTRRPLQPARACAQGRQQERRKKKGGRGCWSVFARTCAYISVLLAL